MIALLRKGWSKDVQRVVFTDSSGCKWMEAEARSSSTSPRKCCGFKGSVRAHDIDMRKLLRDDNDANIWMHVVCKSDLSHAMREMGLPVRPRDQLLMPVFLGAPAHEAWGR